LPIFADSGVSRACCKDCTNSVSRRSVNREHTTAKGERPLFGGHEVGIGFSGTYDSEGAEGEATALAGKRSIRFKAVLRNRANSRGGNCSTAFSMSSAVVIQQYNSIEAQRKAVRTWLRTG